MQVRDLVLRYRAGRRAVLRGLSLDVPAGSKVAVLGRTGAGKSSLQVRCPSGCGRGGRGPYGRMGAGGG